MLPCRDRRGASAAGHDVVHVQETEPGIADRTAQRASSRRARWQPPLAPFARDGPEVGAPQGDRVGSQIYLVRSHSLLTLDVQFLYRSDMLCADRSSGQGRFLTSCISRQVTAPQLWDAERAGAVGSTSDRQRYAKCDRVEFRVCESAIPSGKPVPVRRFVISASPAPLGMGSIVPILIPPMISHDLRRREDRSPPVSAVRPLSLPRWAWGPTRLREARFQPSQPLRRSRLGGRRKVARFHHDEGGSAASLAMRKLCFCRPCILRLRALRAFVVTLRRIQRTGHQFSDDRRQTTEGAPPEIRFSPSPSPPSPQARSVFCLLPSVLRPALISPPPAGKSRRSSLEVP
jgi:hypothetical protein